MTTKTKAPTGRKDDSKSGRSDADRHAEDLKEIQANNDLRRREHKPAEVHAEIVVGEKQSVTVDALGGAVYLDSHGEARLDQTQALNLVQHLQAAFQAVS